MSLSYLKAMENSRTDFRKIDIALLLFPEYDSKSTEELWFLVSLPRLGLKLIDGFSVINYFNFPESLWYRFSKKSHSFSCFATNSSVSELINSNFDWIISKSKNTFLMEDHLAKTQNYIASLCSIFYLKSFYVTTWWYFMKNLISCWQISFSAFVSGKLLISLKTKPFVLILSILNATERQYTIRLDNSFAILHARSICLCWFFWKKKQNKKDL